MESEFAQARSELKMKRAFRMCFSHSVTIAKYPNVYMDRLAQWQQWHQAWVYRIPPTVPMRSSMPLPSGMLTMPSGPSTALVAREDGVSHIERVESSEGEFLNESTDDETIAQPSSYHNDPNAPSGPSSSNVIPGSNNLSSEDEEGYEDDSSLDGMWNFSIWLFLGVWSLEIVYQ